MFFIVPKEGTPLYVLRGFVPVIESFGFTAALREATHGEGFPTMIFSHWAIIDKDPFDPEGNLASKIVAEVRKRKGMPEEIPVLGKIVDKL